MSGEGRRAPLPAMMAGETVMAFSLNDEDSPKPKTTNIADELRRRKAEDLAAIQDEVKTPEPMETMASQFGLVIDDEPARDAESIDQLFAKPEPESPASDRNEEAENAIVGFVGPEGAADADGEPVIDLPVVENISSANVDSHVSPYPSSASETAVAIPAGDGEIHTATDAPRNAPLITANRSIAMLVPAAMLVEGLLGRE